ncbi:MAG: sulfite exporter TauE/SafE family protein [Candidatus Jettenia sp. CY-1]|nr:MAG: sulfite exporter TauE/SafE family protein [Candidatus Jettenia sp.]WKZ19031.1 MAG: sulfite exporter TauE/SafE family protein [Candidatus Jettenia sp. CY-1]
MAYFIICTVALIVSALTLFSGFGLGTLLMPAFAIFFPIEIAVATTAIVHLANNIFKLGLVGRMADLKIVLKFALPASIMAIVGALLLNYFANIQPIAEYKLAGKTFTITAVKLAIATLLAMFSILELSPRFEKLGFHPRYIPLGGALSGFFGGLSGQQGALRSAFLIRTGLKKESFIGTSVVSAVIVDIARLIVYGVTFFSKNFAVLQDQIGIGLVTAATITAFLGSFIGSRLIKKITMRTIQIIVGVLLLLVSLAMAVGLI